MASPPFNISEGVPSDSGIVAQFPTAERSFRDIVESWLLIDHNDLGQHHQISLANKGSDPAYASGVIGIWNNNGRLNSRLASDSGNRIVLWPIGTSTVFRNSVPPAGWSLVVDTLDRVLRINSVGGGIGGQWGISGLSVLAHTLTVNEIPSHTHPSPGGSGFVILEGGGTGALLSGSGNASVRSNTNPTGGGASHTHGIFHDSTWRPLYADVIVATLT